jgi:hypothetical protein
MFGTTRVVVNAIFTATRVVTYKINLCTYVFLERGGRRHHFISSRNNAQMNEEIFLESLITL